MGGEVGGVRGMVRECSRGNIEMALRLSNGLMPVHVYVYGCNECKRCEQKVRGTISRMKRGSGKWNTSCRAFSIRFRES